ncbi:alpha-mannosidase [Phytoactinopolyspora halotolerans]|uniref:Alpha-mannosidase n=2 Tax=Phytoactinopolyspora halotolerans TaxID=1981512 RepID=A0A6L9SF18_9ACTN|nr:glycoside hydrolase family 38 C-terminal domain-containing protein [Phytoactinopolyspora halotolerans]NEE03254.1 alpha-mannosidase [Phytoactinopolyspora halotolerans]
MHAPSILARIGRWLGEYLPDAVLAETVPLDVAAWTVPGVPGDTGEPVPFGELPDPVTFAPVERGFRWGRPWGTTWFHVTGRVPADWAVDRRHRVELSLDLGFNTAKPGFQCEGLVRTRTGQAVKGLEPRNHHVPIEVAPGESFAFLVEAAANPDLSGGDDFTSARAYAPTPYGDPNGAPDAPLYRLGRFEIRSIDAEVERLVREVTVLHGLTHELGENEPRRVALLAGLDRALDELDPGDPAAAAPSARAVLAPLLASPAVGSAHRIVATGHAHIDSAWLWPSRETVRKVTRTFANVVDLMDRDPDAVFTASSAQHFAWLERQDPELYARVKRRVAEGRIVPVGNMWVESDVNMPSGESLARQLSQGTRFFEREFGARSEVGWLPDSFGYPGTLPQLLRKAGLRWFFTQKMCWNDANAMPHHTFLWEGIDGTRVLTHFPPNNTYSGDMRPTELARSVRTFADHAGASLSLMPFGYGDGGGGPTREMMCDARLQSDLEGSPRVRFGTAADFFGEVEREYTTPPVWSGEMYLEFHRGIYTSQSRTKRGNRRNEQLLLEAELWSASATVRVGVPYPYDELDQLWQEVLLLQFHDILPGSAIAWVHREAEASHQRITERLERLIDDALRALVGAGTRRLAVNAAPFRAAGVPAFGGVPADVSVERDVTDAAASGVAGAADIAARTLPDGSIELTSSALRVEITANGLIAHVVDLLSGRDLIPAGTAANLPQLHVDAPAKWDAWDLDRSYRANAVDLVDGTSTLRDDGSVRVERAFGDSRLTQIITIVDDAVHIRTEIDWHERRRMLKLAFPFDIHAHDAAYESQYGHVRRPVHANTAWDAARYEVCAHRWVHVGEPGFGVAVVNDGVYGHDVTRNSADGRVVTTVRQSLLRAPTFPDPGADQGRHTFTTVLVPAPTTDEALRAGARLATPLRRITGAAAPVPLVAVSGVQGGSTSAVMSAVKLADDRSGDVIVRVYESRGARTRATLHADFAVAEARECDLVETVLADGTGAVAAGPGDGIAIELRPFEVLTVRLRRELA